LAAKTVLEKRISRNSDY